MAFRTLYTPRPKEIRYRCENVAGCNHTTSAPAALRLGYRCHCGKRLIEIAQQDLAAAQHERLMSDINRMFSSG